MDLRSNGSVKGLRKQYHYKLKRLFEGSSGDDQFIDTSEQEQQLGSFAFARTFDLVRFESRHKVTLTELINAVALDFGDFTFCPIYKRREAQPVELAAGWRNLHNIALYVKSIESKKTQLNKSFSSQVGRSSVNQSFLSEKEPLYSEDDDSENESSSELESGDEGDIPKGPKMMLKTRRQKAAFAVAEKSKGIKKISKEKHKRKDNKIQKLKRSLSTDDMLKIEELKTAPLPR